MACKKPRRIALRRKLHILKALTKSKSVKKSSIIMDSFLYIYKLKLQVEAIKQEYHHLINKIQRTKQVAEITNNRPTIALQEVKVEKLGGGYLVIRVTCKKGEGLLVPIMEAFEEMKLNVVQARVTCNHFFGVEAIVEEASNNNIDAEMLSEVVLSVIQMQKL